MQFRKVRGTRIQDLIQGKVKLDKVGMMDQKINSYLGVKKKNKE